MDYKKGSKLIEFEYEKFEFMRKSDSKGHFKQHIPALLDKIDKGKPVFFKRLLIGLAEDGFPPAETQQMFETTNIGNGRQCVKIATSKLNCYRELRARYLRELEVSPKAIAAVKGQSHSKSSSGAMLQIYTHENDANPYCVLIENGIPRAVPNLKKKLLLIENLELFIHYKKVLEYINKKCGRVHGGEVALTSWDIAYSQGSGILNKQHLSVLSRYQVIECLFDLDYGGYITYITLKNRLRGVKVKFLAPTEFNKVFEQYGFEMPQSEYIQIENMLKGGRHSKIFKEIMKTALRHRLKVEQEVYLLDETIYDKC
ncbi:TPA: hypothetical protein I7730_14695 [Vibrio vulnificus]|uniref:Wadjet protein JetD C-terminal domain-containing protein n=1 Tax=Vibrio vulnificus TaxID=672 RepID=A0A8H9N1C8_VIBVL|nr:hypothetical protein [Vibrio vulnificus]HAS8541025.1 hypothetical protein [Vibrio vulnificus]